jgi:lipopolysaccharide export system permease protein
MARLSRYLIRLFLVDTLALFGVAAFLLYLIQCIRLFDIVADKGQSLLTLLGQAALGMPPLGMVFLYVCIGIGLGRTLRNLQGRSELHIIHAGGLLPALWRAIGQYVLAGTVLVLFIAHVVDPLCVRAATNWTASIAADIVSRSVVPHKFVDVVPGVSIVIGSRDRQGNITDFFADDHRTETRRTYMAKSALITQDEGGYVLRLHDGAVQYMPPSHQLAQVSFDRYDLALDELTAGPEAIASGPVTSIDLVQAAMAQGTGWSPELISILLKRTAQGLRVIAIGLLVAAIAAFPTGQRSRHEVPVEVTVLGAAFVERAVSSYLPGTGWLQLGTGPLLLLAVTAIILVVRLRVFRPPGIKRVAA